LLQIIERDSEIRDLYYHEFDVLVASESISDAAEGFAATVQILSPGDTATSEGSFVDGLAASFTFAYGGILISIREGTALGTVGQGVRPPPKKASSTLSSLYRVELETLP